MPTNANADPDINMANATESRTSHWRIGDPNIYYSNCGQNSWSPGVCVLCMLRLHQWVQYWQCLANAGNPPMGISLAIFGKCWDSCNRYNTGNVGKCLRLLQCIKLAVVGKYWDSYNVHKIGNIWQMLGLLRWT